MMKILQKIDSLITLKLGISFILSLGSCVFKYGYGFVVNLGHVKFLWGPDVVAMIQKSFYSLGLKFYNQIKNKYNYFYG